MRRKLICTDYFIKLEKKIFKRAQCLCSGSPIRQILGCGISFPPPEFQLAFHIYYVKYEETLTRKRISRTFMEIGNQMRNHKIETNSKLIYEDGKF